MCVSDRGKMSASERSIQRFSDKQKRSQAPRRPARLTKMRVLVLRKLDQLQLGV